MEKYVTSHEAASLLGIPVRELLRRFKAGEYQGYMDEKRKTYIERSSIEPFIESNIIRNEKALRKLLYSLKEDGNALRKMGKGIKNYLEELTAYLPEDYPTLARAKAFLYGVSDCPVCGAQTEWDKSRAIFRTFCSKECGESEEGKRIHYELTSSAVMEKHGGK